MQDSAFLEGEGDAYYQRNKAKLSPDAIDPSNDPVLEIIDKYGIWPEENDAVFEIGCANGFRLEYIRRQTNAWCAGGDASEVAIANGKAQWPSLSLRVDPAHEIPYDCFFDLVIVNYVLHWVDRSMLFRSIAEIDRVLMPGGHLILGDFAPDYPTKTAYQHKQGIWTYKLPGSYAEIFKATGCYSEVAQLTHNHGTHRQAVNVESQNRGATVLLRKGDYYLPSPAGI